MDFSPNHIHPGGRDQLVDNSLWRRLPVRSRNPGDEDGAHQGIVSLKCFLKMSLVAFITAFTSVLGCITEG